MDLLVLKKCSSAPTTPAESKAASLLSTLLGSNQVLLPLYFKQKGCMMWHPPNPMCCPRTQDKPRDSKPTGIIFTKGCLRQAYINS